jgi:patatin-like phospholipase/acyl hydrolase
LTFQILSLSGGGFLGLYTASLLAEIEEQSGRPLADMFDLVAGTSVGGIIALGISAGKSAAEIKQAFLDEGHNIFSPSRPPSKAHQVALRYVANARKSRYSPDPLRQVIERIVGKGTRMSDLRRPTIVPAVNLTKGGPKVFKTGHHPKFVIDWKLELVDVALATSAAPTYFPIHRIGNELFADGGVFANTPDMIALHEAETFLGADRKDIRMLSIGTTTSISSFSSSTSASLGLLGWFAGERLAKMIMGSQQAITHEMMRHILGDRYVRIDSVLSQDVQAEVALDCASPQAKQNLQAAAQSAFAENSANLMLRAIVNNTAPEYKSINASMGD